MNRRLVWMLATPIRAYLWRHKTVGAAVDTAFKRMPVLHDAVLRLVRGDPVERYRAWIAAYDTLDDDDLSAVESLAAGLEDGPLLSLTVSAADVEPEALEALAESLARQLYQRWELWIVGDRLRSPSIGPATKRLLRDERSTIVPGSTSHADALNDALSSATGEFAVFVQPNVVLRPHALLLVAHAIHEHRDALVVYADDDVIDEAGQRADHNFKPDWNKALYRSQDYFGGLAACRRSAALEVGGFREEPDDAYTWSLLLRVTEAARAEAIHHLPFVLSHRRARAGVAGRERERRDRGARAHESRLADLGYPAVVEPVGAASYRVRYSLADPAGLVSVVIPTTGNVDSLRPCVDSVLEKTSYPELELVVVVNNARSGPPEHSRYLASLARRPRVRVVTYGNGPFNFSRVNNWAVEHARGDFVCFLNDDTEVIEGGWLSALLGHVRHDGVAVAGAMLLAPDDRIQHAGVVLGAGGVAAHMYARQPDGFPGYHERALVDQDVSCVTAACMLVRRDVFTDLGGFDESLAIAFNDVDFCLRVRAAGWRIVWTPSSVLYHREMYSIGRHDAGDRRAAWQAEFDLMLERWGEELLADPHYSPNLSLDALELWQPAFPPRVSYPWRGGEISPARNLVPDPAYARSHAA